VRHPIIRFFEWLASHGVAFLIALAMIVGGLWIFAELADEVTEGETQTFDEWAVRALRQPDAPAVPIGPKWLHEVGRDMTALGGIAVLSMVCIAVAGYLLLVRKYHGLILVAVAILGALVLSQALKWYFDRERPSIVPHLSITYSASFPSGHSMMSSAVYLTLGVLLARLVPRRVLKTYFIVIALVLAFLVGVSRVYLGVHYPTDVLAGWMLGLVWALMCYVVARYLQVRGTVERDVEKTVEGEHVPDRQEESLAADEHR
jgi:undecaprenyl-diphosphatase